LFNGDDVSQKAGQIVEIPIKSEDLFDRTFDCYTRFDRILIPQRRSSSHELTPNRCVLLSCGLGAKRSSSFQLHNVLRKAFKFCRRTKSRDQLLAQ
jgi:hypothetical protein